MGYLDNSTIVVDAVLTKEGRARLAGGNGLGISYFTLSDSGIDYRLWNPDHPSGSAYYGEAIENLPSLEAIPRAEFYMRNKLITLNQDVTGLPYWDNHGATNILLDDEFDPIQSDGSYNGVNVMFEFKQAIPGGCVLIINNGQGIESVTGVEGTADIITMPTPEGTSYQSLVNLESSDAAYWSVTPAGSGAATGVLRFKFKRNSVHTDTTATIVETQSGIYNTFNIQTREKLNTNPNSGA